MSTPPPGYPGDPGPPAGARPPAFVASCVFGAIGIALMAVGWASGLDGLFLAGLTSGGLSLACALWWRSQLVASWRARNGPGGGRRPRLN